MSNQRVVVLTDDEIQALYFGEKWTLAEQSARVKLKTAHEHPEEITDDLRAAIDALRDGGSYHVAARLEAALVPGDGEQ